VMVGLVYNRTHTRDIAVLGGLAHNMPVIATVMVIAGLASLGLPSMSGFVAEVMVFLGSVERFAPATILAVVGIVLTAGYILWMVERVFFGPRSERWEGLGDARSWWEQIPMAALAAVIIGVGIYPAAIVDILDMGIQPIIARLG
jgi:NADH-quinone oxidoreductase subunit M